MERHHYCYATDFVQQFPNYSFSAIPSIDAVAASFVRNVLRIQALGRLPIILVGAAIATQTFEMLARFHLNLKHDDPILVFDGPMFDRQIYEQKEILRTALQGAWFEQTQRREVPSGMAVGEFGLGVMIPAGGSETEEGIDAILTGMVTGMCTAFEVLTEDLWRAAVAERQNLEKAITKKEWDMCGFRSTKKVRHLYRFTFRKDEKGIFKVLNDAQIDAVALTRNINDRFVDCAACDGSGFTPTPIGARILDLVRHNSRVTVNAEFRVASVS